MTEGSKPSDYTIVFNIDCFVTVKYWMVSTLLELIVLIMVDAQHSTMQVHVCTEKFLVLFNFAVHVWYTNSSTLLQLSAISADIECYNIWLMLSLSIISFLFFHAIEEWTWQPANFDLINQCWKILLSALSISFGQVQEEQTWK